jgi:hypothetical protein
MAELANSKEGGKLSSNAGGDSSATDPSQPKQFLNGSAKLETGIPNINLGSVEIEFLRKYIFSHYVLHSFINSGRERGKYFFNDDRRRCVPSLLDQYCN